MFTTDKIMRALIMTHITLTISSVETVQFYKYPIPVPAVGRWRTVVDGYQFRTTDGADGSYHFGYDTGTQYDKSYREERRDAQGHVHGRYGYVDPTGILRSFDYFADQHGFRLRSSNAFPFKTSDTQIIGPIPTPMLRYQHNQEIKSHLTP